jgi:hypothetical protein
MRPVMSAGPPAANGTINVTGRVGYDCASVLANPANAARAMAKSGVLMQPSPGS